jgi:hypothetical protein
MRSADKGENWNEIGFVESSGQSNTPKDYGFTDNKPYGSGSMLYKLKIVDNDGSFTFSDEVSVNILPLKYTLYQNYPNPFNPATTIKYIIPSVGTSRDLSVQLKIYNILGQEVATLVNEQKPAGTYQVKFDASNMASGVYLYQLRTEGGFSATKKLLFLK